MSQIDEDSFDITGDFVGLWQPSEFRAARARVNMSIQGVRDALVAELGDSYVVSIEVMKHEWNRDGGRGPRSTMTIRLVAKALRCSVRDLCCPRIPEGPLENLAITSELADRAIAVIRYAIAVRSIDRG
jgi:hypothetical protein